METEILCASPTRTITSGVLRLSCIGQELDSINPFQVMMFNDPMTRNTSSHPPFCAAVPHCHHRSLLVTHLNAVSALMNSTYTGLPQVNRQSRHCCQTGTFVIPALGKKWRNPKQVKDTLKEEQKTMGGAMLGGKEAKEQDYSWITYAV